MTTLFDALDDARRQRLRERGWKWLVSTWGRVRWQRPDDKAWLTEVEAFVQLERLERQQSLTEDPDDNGM